MVAGVRPSTALGQRSELSSPAVTALVRRLASHLTALAGGLLLALAWMVGPVGLAPAYRPAMAVAAVLVTALAWRFRRGRLAGVALVVAITNHLLSGPLADQLGGVGGPGLDALALLLPLNLGVLALVRERPLTRASTLVHLALVTVQAPLVAALLALVAAPAPLLVPLLELAATPQTSLLAFLMAGVFTLLALALRSGAADIAVPWVLAAAAIAVHGVADAAGAAVVLFAAQLIVLLGLVEESYRLAFHDELTGLPGRRALNEALANLPASYALAMVDVDHFKQFNDRYGHDAGDQALRMVAECLRAVGGDGLAYRYGGEEFTVVYTGAAAATAEASLEALREAIAARSFGLRAPKRPKKKPELPPKRAAPIPRVQVTVSLGLARPNSRRVTPEEVLAAADRALYRAKDAGRNRLVVG